MKDDFQLVKSIIQKDNELALALAEKILAEKIIKHWKKHLLKSN